MGGTLPGVTTLMSAFDKILSAFNLNNSRGNWFYQTERNKMPSPEEAAMFFHTVEVNLKLNQTTTVVGWVPNAAKVHAIEPKPKAKPKAKSASSPERVKCSSAPSTPLRTEGPAPPREAYVTPAPKENPQPIRATTTEEVRAKRPQWLLRGTHHRHMPPLAPPCQRPHSHQEQYIELQCRSCLPFSGGPMRWRQYPGGNSTPSQHAQLHSKEASVSRTNPFLYPSWLH